MRKSRFRLLSWLLIAALLLTMAPILPAQVNAATVTPSPYFQFRDFSIDSANPTDVNSNVQDIAGSYSSVAVSSISYKVEQITITGTTVKVIQSNISSTKPIINGQSFVFNAVSLYSGLNRITVLGTSDSGNSVSAQAYVNFSDVPAISEIKLSSGGNLLSSNTPLITTNPAEAITVKAVNATDVTLNGVQMFPGASTSFVISNLGLQPGANKLVFVAKNGSKTYEVTKYLVYYDGSMTAYDLQIGGVSVDGNASISQTANLSGKITAKVIQPYKSGYTPKFNYHLTGPASYTAYDETNVSVASVTYVPATTPVYSIYTLTGTTPGPTISSNGSYTLQVEDANATPTPAVFPATFDYRNSGSPFIKDIKQAYGATETGTVMNSTSSGSFPNNASISKVPLWLYLETSNFPSGTTTITAEQNGVALTAAEFTAVATYTAAGDTTKPAIKISKMPTGVIDLTITITSGGNSDTIKRIINFSPVSYIQVDSIYDGQKFDAQFTSGDLIKGKLINFDLTNNAELDTLMLNFNGEDFPLVKANSGATTGPARLASPDGSFVFDPTSTPVGGKVLKLVEGPNKLIFKGVAAGIPVSTSMTVYYFSGTNPSIKPMTPVPHVSDLSIDKAAARLFSDAQQRFKLAGNKQYTTTEKSVDVLIDVASISAMDVQMNGTKLATISVNSNSVSITYPNALTKMGICMENKTTNTCEQTLTITTAATPFQIRLWGIDLPRSGPTNITLVHNAGSGQIVENLTITRDLSPYIVLSPKLPEQSVINSNFLMVSIQAEGADRVTIGKADMVKGDQDIFRYEVKNLKPGKNTISFTVLTGKQKVNGKVAVNYAADNSITAQYKSTLPSSGKVSMFKGELGLTFPKNTFLREANVKPGQDVKTVDLFDAQELYFGIADRTDGQVVKKYNAVGIKDPLATTEYMDGRILPALVASGTGTDYLLHHPTNFSYSSNLFWVDAGYFTTPTTGTGTLVNGTDPYAINGDPMDVFYNRAQYPKRWLEPSQRGAITLKYDPNIRDALGPSLSVWRYTGTAWQNIGGIVNTKNKTVTASFDGFGYYVVMSLRYSYSDVIGHSYARTAMEAMYSHGIMKNRDYNSFGAYENITRGEFAQMLVKMLDIPLEFDPNNMTFDDVQAVDYNDVLWDYRYVETAVKKGFIRGKSPRLFMPNDPLTREQACIMIDRAFNMVKSNANPDKDKAALQKQFTDGGQIDIYAASAILAVVKAKYMSGIPNNTPPKTFRFEPATFLNRADAAMIATTVMKAKKRL